MPNQANIKAVITTEDRGSAGLKNFGKNVEGLGSNLSKVAKRATLAFSGMAAAAGAFGLKTAADLESSRQGFVTLLGSAEAADKTMARIKKEAARTPFEIAGLTQATQLLSGVTKNGDRALEFILNIGEGLAAMGRGQAELDRVAVNLQQIAATGRAFSMDIRQFAFAGIPIYEMLQESIGKTGEELEKFIEEGGVTFELLEKLFKQASSEGGRWAGAFERQTGTFNQSLANMKDSFAIFVSDFVTKTGIFDKAKSAIQGLTTIINGNNEAFNAWLPRIAAVVAALVAFKASLMVISALTALQAGVVALGSGMAAATVKTVGLRTALMSMALPGGAFALVAAAGAGAAVLIASEWRKTKQAIDAAKASTASLNKQMDQSIAKGKLTLDQAYKIQNSPGYQGKKTIGKTIVGNEAIYTPEFATGGFTGRGASSDVAGVVHKGEYVLPQSAVDQNTGMPKMGGGLNVTIAPQIGVYTGSDIEMRKLTAMIIQSIKDIAGMQGKTVAQLIGT